jgi:xanthine dehydrogenase YagR molybdenum-binding subunit
MKPFAADSLQVAVEEIEVRIGDTDYPKASVAGGSTGMATWGSAMWGGASVPREVRPDPGRRRHRGRLTGAEPGCRAVCDVRLRCAVRRSTRPRRHP